MNNIEEKINQIYRCHDILDESVLRIIRKVKRELFVPSEYKSFSDSDFAIPLKNNENMLTPFSEAKIIQAMGFSPNDNVLLIGTGSGYLTECISYLCNSIKSYEIDHDIYEFGKRNIDLHSKNKSKIELKNTNILKELDELEIYSKVIFTCSVDSFEEFLIYLGENTQSFFYINQYNSPYKSGIIIEKTRNGYTVNKNIVTSETNKLMD